MSDEQEKTGSKKDEIVFFGEVDRHPRGGFSSEYPAWYYENQLNDLKEELKGKESALQLRLGNNAELAFQVNQIRTRIKDIEASNKTLTSPQKDRLSKIHASAVRHEARPCRRPPGSKEDDNPLHQGSEGTCRRSGNQAAQGHGNKRRRIEGVEDRTKEVGRGVQYGKTSQGKNRRVHSKSIRRSNGR
jgi:hypothetical protein